ncbi:FecR family protein [Pedobacter borealis]|uniref:FecR family protein n=1 Tax=Pedobacter borealis TaxID=475254 RepID=UPI00069006F3|nr:FecR family protein [Pedobacter borealis]
MNQQERQQFLTKMASGNHTEEEYKVFSDWVNSCSREEYEHMLRDWGKFMSENEPYELVDSRLIKKIESGLDDLESKQSPLDFQYPNDEPQGQQSLWPRLAVAASILLLLSVGIYSFLRKKQANEIIVKNRTHDLAPGGNKAVLTLANGQRIVLDNEKNGVIANQGNTAVNKKQDGHLVFDANPALASQTAVEVYDTLTTPRAGVYHLTLADGSRVWLNSATSIRFPATFNGKSRTVELIYGEAYYEVIHNDNKPFSVIVGRNKVQDIGTHFNINAYQDEPVIKTTLLEGSVKVSNSAEAVLLKPGQQSQINTLGSNRQIKVVNDIDTDEIVAWKNGLFQFTDADIQTVMRQLARWYDVEVVYKGNVSKRLFTGDIHKDINASQAMQILTYLKINYKIEGKKIIITSTQN